MTVALVKTVGKAMVPRRRSSASSQEHQTVESLPTECEELVNYHIAEREHDRRYGGPRGANTKWDRCTVALQIWRGGDGKFPSGAQILPTREVCNQIRPGVLRHWIQCHASSWCWQLWSPSCHANTTNRPEARQASGGRDQNMAAGSSSTTVANRGHTGI